jgi:DHA2 family multidrug resistance protein-like MFS transporter
VASERPGATEMDPTPTQPKATRREWIGLAVIALPCLVYAMDMTVLNLALPALSAQFKPSAAQLLWIVDIYGFMVAGFLITMGTLGDRIGRRKLLLFGAAAFAFASVLAAFATSAPMLIAARALLGVAGATLAPSTMSLIRNMFHDEHERQFAIGIWIASFSLGATIGPLVGGVLLEWFWWGSVFLLALPVMALTLLLGPVLLPEYKDPQAGRLDLASVGLSLAAVLATIWGLKRMAEHGVSALAVGVALAGLALGWAFVRRQRRIAYPLLDLGLFRQPAFTAALTAYALSGMAMMGVYIFITQFLQTVLGLTPLYAGLATAPWALAFVFGSLAAPKLARRIPDATIIVGGLAVAALAFAALTVIDHPYALAVLVAATVMMSLGLAPVFTLGNQIIISAAPPERAGAASALSETSAEFSGALGIALFGSVGTIFYRTQLAATQPAGVTAEVAAQAQATIGGALAAASTLPAPVGEALAGAARAAFVDTLQIAAAVGAAIVTAAALLAARILRSRTAPGRCEPTVP